MALPALSLVALFSIATAQPQHFYYQAAYQPYQAAYQPYQQAYQVAYPAYNPHVLPIPLAAHGFAHHYIPAIPTHPIYSEKARVLQGYSYETQDVAGGHGQVIYVSGPNSHQIFQQNAKALHFALPTVPIFTVAPSNSTETTSAPATESPTEMGTEAVPDASAQAPAFPSAPQAPAGQLPQVDYIRAEVLPPHTRIVVGELPLISYSIITNAIPSKPNELEVGGNQTTSTTEQPAAQREENDTDKSDSSTTVAPSSTETDSSSSSDAASASEENASQNDKVESSTEELESSTETADS